MDMASELVQTGYPGTPLTDFNYDPGDYNYSGGTNDPEESWYHKLRQPVEVQPTFEDPNGYFDVSTKNDTMWARVNEKGLSFARQVDSTFVFEDSIDGEPIEFGNTLQHWFSGRRSQVLQFHSWFSVLEKQSQPRNVWQR